MQRTAAVAPIVPAGGVIVSGRRGVNSRAVTTAAWLLGLVVAVLVTAAVVLAVLNRVTLADALSEFFVAVVAASISFGAVGTLLALRRPQLRLGWLLCGSAITFTLPAVTAQYARYAVVSHPGALPAGQFVGWLAMWTWPIGYGLLLVGIPLLFPDGKPPTPRWRLVGWAGLTGVVLLTVGSAFSSGVNPDLPELTNPYAVAGTLFPAVAHAGTVVLLGALIAALCSVVVRYRGSSGVSRLQLRWFLGAVALLVFTEVFVQLVTVVITGQIEDAVLAATEALAAITLPAAAIGVAVLRHQLYDIDIFINRALVYAVMTSAVVVFYVGVVGYLGAAVHVHGAGPSLMATGLVAVLFNPARERVQRGVNRLFYGRRDDPYAVLTDLGRRLETTLSPTEVLSTITETVRDALRVPYAAVRLSGVIGPSGRVESGIVADIAARLPLVFGPDQVGELLIAARHPGEELEPLDLRLLADFARQAAVAASAVVLMTDLQQARERLVTAREEERRRLRRDLHDGLGPQLASQPLVLDAARALVRQDPDAADALLLNLREQTQQAVAEVRRIVHNLRPPALDDRGLAAALREHVAHYENTGLDVSIELSAELPRLSAAVEVAAYRIATEAVTNSARHARGRHCTIAVGVDPAQGDLVLNVSDDGRGFTAGRPAGIGLSSMRARAAELGGTCVVASDDAGTQVTSRLPLLGKTL